MMRRIMVFAAPPPLAWPPLREPFEKKRGFSASQANDRGVARMKKPFAAFAMALTLFACTAPEPTQRVVLGTEGRTQARGISDEQDFEAVSERETIESDAVRLERLKGRFVQLAPIQLPDRKWTVDIASYALDTTHAVGTTLYPRRRNVWFRGRDNCGRFKSDDDAQAAFLLRGGPVRDTLNVDPDGDGFACSWDPELFRGMLN